MISYPYFLLSLSFKLWHSEEVATMIVVTLTTTEIEAVIVEEEEDMMKEIETVIVEEVEEVMMKEIETVTVEEVEDMMTGIETVIVGEVGDDSAIGIIEGHMDLAEVVEDLVAEVVVGEEEVGVGILQCLILDLVSPSLITLPRVSLILM